MKRTTITWPDETASAVERVARRRNTSVSAVVRELVEKQLAEERKTSPFEALIGLVDVELPYSAADIEDELAKTWADSIMKHRDQ
ncbi:MAG: ribbon-helix-helix protein, CopG family [Dehalococcoidia bacterium]